MMMSGLTASGSLPSRGPCRQILETITRQFFEPARLHDVRKRAQDVRNLGVGHLHQPPTSVVAQ